MHDPPGRLVPLQQLAQQGTRHHVPARVIHYWLQHSEGMLEGLPHVPDAERGSAYVVPRCKRVLNAEVSPAVTSGHNSRDFLLPQVAAALQHTDTFAGILKLKAIKLKEAHYNPAQVLLGLWRHLQLE